jgi:hypothetical protein
VSYNIFYSIVTGGGDQKIQFLRNGCISMPLLFSLSSRIISSHLFVGRSSSLPITSQAQIPPGASCGHIEAQPPGTLRYTSAFLQLITSSSLARNNCDVLHVNTYLNFHFNFILQFIFIYRCYQPCSGYFPRRYPRSCDPSGN